MAANFIGGRNRSTRRKPPTCSKSLANLMLYRVHLAWAGFELVALVVICTDCIGGCKSNYHTITTTTALIYDNTDIGDLKIVYLLKLLTARKCNTILIRNLLYQARIVSGHVFVLGYRFFCFLWFWYWIMELFLQCGIFGIGLWNYSYSVVFLVLDYRTIPTVWYFLVLDYRTIPTVWYFWYWIIELFLQCGIFGIGL